MGAEDNIIRSTYYCPKYLHNKAKEAGINISKEIQNYLETVLFGDNVCDVQYQREELIKKKKTLEVQLTSINSRIGELDKIIEEHDVKLQAQKAEYMKFINHCKSRIKNSKQMGIAHDFTRIKHFWKKEYFGENGLTDGKVKQILSMVDNEKFSMDHFKELKRGAFVGN